MVNRSPLSDIDELVAQLARVAWKERDAIKAQLQALALAYPERAAIQAHLEEARKGLTLEVRWEIDEILEALQPPPAPPEEPPEEEEVDEDPNRPLSAADLNLVYDDPRGLALHKTKKGDRWFMTQVDPASGQPRTFELHPQEVQQLKTQLTGSPYWVLGSGAVG